MDDDTIRITDGIVRLNGHKLSLDKFCGLVSENTVSGMQNDPIPDGVKWVVKQGPWTVCIVELPPGLQNIEWLRKRRTVATPYVVLAVVFNSKCTFPYSVELYYRNEPLSSLDDSLYHCNLLNVAPAGWGKARLCTSNTDFSHCQTQGEAISEIVHCLWGGQFNQELDQAGHRSWFTRSRRAGIDPRVTNIERWEAESKKDPEFVLGVEWLNPNYTVRDLIQTTLQYLASPNPAPDHNQLANHMLVAK